MNETAEFTADKRMKSTTEENETGNLPVTMKNDYMFKAVMQLNGEALKDMLSVCLHKDKSKIKSIHLENPIILGETIDAKTVILDIHATLLEDEGTEDVNVEMQVVGQDFWSERTLTYVCRNFCTLNKGDTYNLVKPVVFIGITDFRRDPKNTKLYSEYELMDKETGRVYSDKLRLNELCLPNIENATEEERRNGLYDWASFFAAKTWEELKMAAKNEAMKSAVVTMKKLTADEKVRLQCEARERYLLDQLTQQAVMRDKDEKLREEKNRRKEEEKKRKEEEKKRKEEEKKRKEEENKRKEAEAKNQALYEMMRQNPSMTAAEILEKMEDPKTQQ